MIKELKLPGVERPLTPPEYGAKTAQAVLDLIRLHPEMHSQSDWVRQRRIGDRECGTTLCVAGWAQWLHEGTVLGPLDFLFTCPDRVRVDEAAIRYLGLSQAEGGLLFFSTTNRQAVAALEYLARGEPIDWEAVRVR